MTRSELAAAAAPRCTQLKPVWREGLADRAQALLDFLEDEQNAKLAQHAPVVRQQHRKLPRTDAWLEEHKTKNSPAPGLALHNEELAMSRFIAETVAQGFKV